MLYLKGLRHGYNLCRSMNTILVRHYKAKFKDGGDLPTFNDYPVPSGSWHEENARKQKTNNIIFVSGILAFAGSVALVAFSDMMPFNFFIPDYPYKEEEEEEEEGEGEGDEKEAEKATDKPKPVKGTEAAKAAK